MGLIFVAAGMLAKRTGFALFPASERPMFYIDVDAAAGSNLGKTDELIALVDSVLQEYVAPEFKTQHLLPDSIE